MYEELSFYNEERAAAEDVARRLYNELHEIGFILDDIDIVNPCEGCRESSYMIRLGNMAVADIEELTAVIRKLKQ